MKRYAVLNRGLGKLDTLEELLGVEIVRSYFITPKRINGTLGWGRKKYTKRAQNIAKSLGIVYYCIEDGFLRSIDLGKKSPPLSILVDDLGIYYDATKPSRLETLIMRELSLGERLRADSIIDIWKKNRVSKYNYSREYNGSLPSKYILVADQTLNDDSIFFGLADKQSFNHMLTAALSENPDHVILVKVHPEVVSGHKKGNLDIAHLMNNTRIQIISDDVHPVRLIENSSAIYVVTSQIGFEGLLWGKKVHTFGMPFYAGWGLTYDKLPAPIRRKAASLQNLVHASLVDYARYIHPETRKNCCPETLIEWIGLQRCMSESLPENIYALGFSEWKKSIVRNFCQGSSIKFIKQLTTASKDFPILIWGKKEINENIKFDSYENSNLETKVKLPIIRIEDGFLRSVGLGAELVKPASLVIDSRGIYYDSTTESDLEYLLQTTVFSKEIISRAKVLRENIVRNKITKYNVGSTIWQRPKNTERVILVPGQVESDASLTFGSPLISKNIDLLCRVREINPTAYIVYKIHPDVVAGLRNKNSNNDEEKLKSLCNEVIIDCTIGDMLMNIDEVHVMTSLAGFEALLRNKKVITYGQPFYSSWGLTVDYCPVKRRNRKLSLDELVAGVLILYPRYISTTTGKYSTPERILNELSSWSNENTYPIWRKLLRLALSTIKQ